MSAGARPATPVPALRAPSPWNLPNALTVLRVLLVPVFCWALLVDGGDRPGWRFAAFGVFLLAIITDSVDGDLARRRGLVTDFGTVADPIADKALIGAALLGLSWLGELPWWVSAVVLVRELGITALRFLVMRHGIIPASRGGKLKTCLQSVAIAALLLPLPDGLLRDLALGAMGLAVVVTVLTGADYVVQAFRARAERRRRPDGTAAAPEREPAHQP